jgi:hypothetical protein
LNFQGLCCFNYKLVDGQPVIFELNPRFGGSLPRDINRMLFALQHRLMGVAVAKPKPDEGNGEDIVDLF